MVRFTACASVLVLPEVTVIGHKYLDWAISHIPLKSSLRTRALAFK